MKMAEDMRHVGIYGAAGILVAVLVIAGIVTSSMNFPSLRLPSVVLERGTLVIKLTDAPVDLEELYVNISSIEAQKVIDENEVWIPLSFVNGKSWVNPNILELQDKAIDLSVTVVEAGKYAKLRMFINSAKAVENGVERELIVPPGKIDVIVYFEVEAGENTRILLDFEADWVAISQTDRLRPVLKATLLPGE